MDVIKESIMSLFIDVSAMLVLALGQTGGPIGVGWSAPTKYTNGSLISNEITYNLYRSHNGGPYMRVRTGIVGIKASITKGLVPGEVECFKVTATSVVSAESAYSSAGCVVST
jgi:hypothetical protein